ncbi:unnamed protein product, partial [marine sediment metagenome]
MRYTPVPNRNSKMKNIKMQIAKLWSYNFATMP